MRSTSTRPRAVLDLDLDAYLTAREPRRLLELIQHQRERLDLSRRLHLGQHHDVEPHARRRDDGNEIIDREGRVPRIDAHTDDLVVPLHVVQSRNRPGTGRWLL